MEIEVSLNGIYPRSEKLIKATRDYDRNRISYEELLRIYDEDYKELKNLQSDFNIVSDGLLMWQDLLRPFSVLCNCEINGLKRYFETNTFYRVIKFNDYELKNIDKFLEFFKFGNLAILPSLGIFKYFSENYNLDKIVDIYGEILKLLNEKGYSHFYFQEPSLGFYKDFELLDELKLFFKRIRSGVNGKMILNTYFADISEVIGKIFEFEIDGIGIDFTLNDIETITRYWKNRDLGLVAGIVDTNNSYIEGYDNVKKLLDRIMDNLKPKFLILTGSSDFYFLPRDIANKKLDFLKYLKDKVY
ncbi:MAG: hypothetical protein RMJ38_00905 [candidate division WOR-3 bacterium]|nr:hypothetical protein [candidate division WOR-3 bacterium]MDW8149988.1 hypothetical protein [candidate division WOR-3 bacterium]